MIKEIYIELDAKVNEMNYLYAKFQVNIVISDVTKISNIKCISTNYIHANFELKY